LPEIHPTAVVSPKAELGEGVSVGPFAIVEEGTRIGDGTTIGPHALIAKGTTLGRDCQVHYSAVVGTIPQDMKFSGEETALEVGDRTIIREFATLNRGTTDRWRTVVGSDCLIMAYAHVAHDCMLGNHVIMANCASLAGHVVIEDYAILGGLVAVHQWVRIGQHSFIGGGYRVPKDVPPFVRAAGEPLRPAGLNSVGLRRRGFSPETMRVLKKAYRILFRSGLNTTQAIERIGEEVELIPEIRTLVEFIESSERGIIK